MSMIEVIVSPQGQSQTQTKGFTGVTCRAASLFLERALGEVLLEQLTPEFHQIDSSQQSVENERL